MEEKAKKDFRQNPGCKKTRSALDGAVHSSLLHISSCVSMVAKVSPSWEKIADNIAISSLSQQLLMAQAVAVIKVTSSQEFIKTPLLHDMRQDSIVIVIN
jgi:hypothetical protein